MGGPRLPQRDKTVSYIGSYVVRYSGLNHRAQSTSHNRQIMYMPSPWGTPGLPQFQQVTMGCSTPAPRVSSS